MMFKTLDPNLAKLLVKHDEDILTPRAEKRSFAVASTPCPECGGTFRQCTNPVMVFTQEEPLPRVLAECDSCGFTYDPHNGIIVGMGNPAKVRDPFEIPQSED